MMWGRSPGWMIAAYNHFSLQDLITVGAGISLPRPAEIVNEVAEAVRNWPEFAARAGLRPERTAEIGRYHRLDILL